MHQQPELPAKLSLRELQILHHLSEGLSSKQIADKLCLSKHTVDTHRRNMLRKKAARNTAQLVAALALTG